MKNYLFAGMGLVTISILLQSCNTDTGDGCPVPLTGALASGEAKLTGDWLLTAIVADKDIDLTDDEVENPQKDLYAQYTDCQRDLAYRFMTDRTYHLFQGQVAEDCENKITTGGTWKLGGNILTLVGNCTAQSIDVIFNADATQYSFFDDFTVRDVKGSTMQARVTFTYSKQ